MCTVTIIPNGKTNFVLTSNRDEAPHRLSLPPDYYFKNSTKILFPMDELSGGTWIGISDKNRVVCVLNGGLVRHKRKKNYRKSRGLIALDFLICETITSTIKTYNLDNIEPFTVIIVDWNENLKFYELVWDGKAKHFKELPLEPKIWSSATLYNDAMKQERFQWFEDYKTKNKLNAQTLMKFHKTAGTGNEDYGVIMNRGLVKTTSITQIEKFGSSLEMCYENLQNKTISSKSLHLHQTVNE